MPRIGVLFPGSCHVTEVGLANATDRAIWEFARAADLTILTQDSDFHDLNALFGAPPRVIWLRIGNATTRELAAYLEQRTACLRRFASDPEASILAL